MNHNWIAEAHHVLWVGFSNIIVLKVKIRDVNSNLRFN